MKAVDLRSYSRLCTNFLYDESFLTNTCLTWASHKVLVMYDWYAPKLNSPNKF